LQELIATLPWMRFELVEHVRLPQDSSFASICEFGPLWLDDFGTGMANFSALSEVRYDYIKVARDLFIMLRQTPEGRNLFTLLLQLMNRYCQGVIVEGVETLEEWRDVQNSPAAAAQGYFLSRPVPMDRLDSVITTSDKPASLCLDYSFTGQVIRKGDKNDKNNQGNLLDSRDFLVVDRGRRHHYCDV
jgi:EAL domain-containing protein (putative c-di-GMP-specific phosphodiesterase class I)